MSEILLDVKNLCKYYPVSGGTLHAVDDVSFHINKGETLGLVGESGCGKSTIGRTVLRLIPHTSGEVHYKGENILTCSPARLRSLRRQIQIIFQDPYSCLDPRKTIGQIISEPLVINRLAGKKELNAKVLDLMSKGGVSRKLYNAYPHELDGGRRQRVGIIRALAMNPEFIVCDEPVSSLDVSIQAQILNLLQEMQENMGLTYLFISHDLSVVRHISNRIIVMYLGKIVEICRSRELFANPVHPYTRALLSAVPIAKYNYNRREQILLKGDVPSPVNPRPGCRFANRCWMAKEICHQETPELKNVGTDHQAACHFVG
ncbi:ATP-binding cassette domain-containing protein [Clostridium sp. AF18-27]|uniref:ABC transporter ATP-binding protein n=1 Tax=Enterocloster lavalensis TaxID=460384 RepID=UPI000E504D56|nr:oligopeptide/dipeptide ABC transporter ATP-binding protein [Enterocloster lavalensis]MBS5606827.1 ATP-binding cassette domain-containing protein [Enterocloster asparagiformis]MCB6345657.1 ATP-binding cassette domain-containing protein [Enterocloster lavalensis]RHR55166.1 ATP-binding cassette domain-containing protein [Clostridium sp. AF18-27]